MPSPSENKAVDLFLAAFPGSEVVSVDRTKPIDKKKMQEQQVVDDGWGDRGRIKKPKPPDRKPRPKRTKQTGTGLFDEA